MFKCVCVIFLLLYAQLKESNLHDRNSIGSYSQKDSNQNHLELILVLVLYGLADLRLVENMDWKSKSKRNFFLLLLYLIVLYSSINIMRWVDKYFIIYDLNYKLESLSSDLNTFDFNSVEIFKKSH